MNKVVTGESRGRWAGEEGRVDVGCPTCMPCSKKRGVETLQTKEHMWGGSCVGTEAEVATMWDEMGKFMRVNNVGMI